MTKYSFILIIGCLVGCQLPPNQAVKEHNINPQQWVNTLEAEQKLSQGLTASIALDDAFESIASRIYLIKNAKSHLDIQYYIWQNDFVGQMLLSELLNAADRGVKIRLLIDDQNGTQLDEQLLALLQHPNFKIKIYNPYKYRNFRALDFLLRPKQVNRRMHNKLMIADGSIAVTGGRNISSEYFDASENFQFTDLDILFYGQAVEQANTIFHTFWNDDLSYQLTQVLSANEQKDLVDIREYYKQYDIDTPMEHQKLRLAQLLLESEMESQRLEWSKAHFIADHPHKTRAQATPETLLSNQILKLMPKPKKNLDVVSAYFVPTEEGARYLADLAKNNVKVRVLTNSYLANDVAIVHAFYKDYRKPLLESGVEIYEFKSKLERNDQTWYEVLTGNMIPAAGKSNSSLHAKFFDMDGRVFIGSFNFDPRSMVLNTEVGLVIESKGLQDTITQRLDTYLPTIAYQVKLDKNGELIWLETTAQGVITHPVEPGTNQFQRLMMNFIALTPFEGMM